MTDSRIESAKKLLANGVPPKDVARNLGVSVPTLYRWLPASIDPVRSRHGKPARDLSASLLLYGIGFAGHPNGPSQHNVCLKPSTTLIGAFLRRGKDAIADFSLSKGVCRLFSGYKRIRIMSRET
jgi:hypothetical protein